MGQLRTARFHLGTEDLVVLSWPHSDAALTALTEAERAVALLANEGLSNTEIAQVRGVSARTIANQLASVFAKLGIGSRVELARRLAT